MRVATRRLRSTLQSFPAILHKPAVEHLRGELKWLGGVLGDAREAEVLSERLLAALAAMPMELVMGPAEARVRVHFAPRVAGARTAVTSALDSGRYFALLEALDELIADPPLTAKAALPARNVLSKAVRRGGGRTRRRIRRALRTPAGRNRDAALHEVRKAARRARYATEAAKPVLGKRARRFARRMKAVQSILGDQHDAVNARRDQGDRRPCAPRGRERVQLRPAARTGTPRRARVPARGQASVDPGFWLVTRPGPGPRCLRNNCLPHAARHHAPRRSRTRMRRWPDKCTDRRRARRGGAGPGRVPGRPGRQPVMRR
jgi:CHAD domain-containing protein